LGAIALKKSCAGQPEVDYHAANMGITGRQPGIPVTAKLESPPWISRPRDLHSTFPAILRFALGALVLAISIGTAVRPSQAQKPTPPSGGRPASPEPSGPSAPIMGIDNPFQPNAAADPSQGLYTSTMFAPIPANSVEMLNSEACNSWTASGVKSPTVSVTRLLIPGKASSEYQKGCGAYKDKKLALAEDHVRRAIDIYPDYAAAWVVLGQVLDAQSKRDDARSACSKASTIDPTYVAPYLCLAEFAATEENWKQVSTLADEALALDPVGNPYSLYYTADSALHLNNLAQAETNALAAVQLDAWHHLPQLHLLLAQVYAAKGDPRSETTELRTYLKIAPNSRDAAGAKETLAQIEAHPSK